ncbi:MAG: hypothetical protein D6832_06615 [Alphaproteobacteria bacterium]|nr:MAG: hypothetical protein D6832_06615 [Alphaproteobacteria bacterium]
MGGGSDPDLPRPGVAGWRAALRAIDAERIDRFLELTGADPDLAIAAHQRWGCAIGLLPLDRRGRPKAGARWPEAYRARLIAAGVPAEAITRHEDLAGAGRADLLAALGGFGLRHRIRNAGPALEALLAERGFALFDIARGSGGFPFLKDFGNPQPLPGLDWQHEGRTVQRVLLTAEPAADAAVDLRWARIARGLIGPEGFLREGGQHSFTFIPRGPVLCVTFDNLDIAMNKREDRRPWGFGFIEAQGWSMLAVMAGGWTWFRDPFVWEEFDRLAAEGFFGRFEKVIFYGASMGGYGALAYSAAAPGADVVVFSPQTVLDKRKVPWETRYRVAWDRDWSGPYADAAETIRTARRVNVFYDPWSELDARHVARLSGPNLRLFRAPFMGHRLGTLLQRMGVLKPLVLAAAEGRLTEREFYRTLRARRAERRYRRELVDLAIDRGHPRLAARLCRRVLAEGHDSFFADTLARLAAEGHDPGAPSAAPARAAGG